MSQIKLGMCCKENIEGYRVITSRVLPGEVGVKQLFLQTTNAHAQIHDIDIKILKIKLTPTKTMKKEKLEFT